MTELEQKILASIERQNLAPRPAYVFFAKRSVFWLLAALSVVLGGVSFAILLYGLKGYAANGWNSFDEIPLEELLFSIPVAWLVSMPLLMASAYFGFRNTRRGYRLRPVTTAALAFAASLAIGLFLHIFGVGLYAHEFLERNVPFYERLTHIPYAEWSRPDEGFLGGHADKMLDQQTLIITDFKGVVWTINIADATVILDNPVVDEGDVAIRGTRTGLTTFRAETITEFD